MVIQSIALKVVQELKTISGKPMEAWTACNFVDMPQGLMFHVANPKYKGYVYVRYEQSTDTYHVQFGKLKKSGWVVEREESLGQDFANLLGKIIK